MTTPAPVGHVSWFDDAHRILDIGRVTPGLPKPHILPAIASFDYRHVVHAEDAREAVTAAVAALSEAFTVTFTERPELAGDGTPRYLLQAHLPSGLPLTVISRVSVAALAGRGNLRAVAA
jgi:hypothetical protein